MSKGGKHRDPAEKKLTTKAQALGARRRSRLGQGLVQISACQLSGAVVSALLLH
jgi:hypothetical protein